MKTQLRTVDTIEQYVMEMANIASSSELGQLTEHAQMQEAAGFTTSALNDKVRKLASFTESADLAEQYKREFPNAYFIPWSAMHMVRVNLDISLDLASNYRGAVPAEQLDKITKFDMEAAKAHNPTFSEFISKVGDKFVLEVVTILGPVLQYEEGSRQDQAAIKAGFKLLDLLKKVNADESSTVDRDFSSRLSNALYNIRNVPNPSKIVIGVAEEMFETLKSEYKQACKEVVLLAPHNSFKTQGIDLVKRLVNAFTKAFGGIVPPIPRDPLAMKLVKGGCLVIAAWGEEADELNRYAQEEHRAQLKS